MQPIDKFEWKDNTDKEKELLEYISILEKLYIPDFDYDTDSPYYYGYKRMDKSEVKVAWLFHQLRTDQYRSSPAFPDRRHSH